MVLTLAACAVGVIGVTMAAQSTFPRPGTADSTKLQHAHTLGWRVSMAISEGWVHIIWQ